MSCTVLNKPATMKVESVSERHHSEQINCTSAYIKPGIEKDKHEILTTTSDQLLLSQ